MSPLFDWTAVALLAGLLTGTFVGFRGAEPRLWMRLVLAFFGLGLLITTPVVAWSVSQGISMNMPTEAGLVLLALTAFLWFNIIRYALRPRPVTEPGMEPRRWGCFRTLFAIAAFIVVGYAGIVIVVFGLAGLMGLVVAASG